MKGVVIGGTASGVGKTVASIAVARAIANEGYTPVPAKAGPDFIDPSHHAAVLGRPSRTLDTWMQGVDGVRRNLYRAVDGDGERTGTDTTRSGDDGHVAIVEGMMGLYDGSVTSTAATAAALEAPVVLVIDASAGMQSVGATALGFREYARHVELPESARSHEKGSQVPVVGIIATRAHEGRHVDGIRDSLPSGIGWFGHVPPLEGLEIPDRHLGLHMGDENPLPDSAIERAAEGLDGEVIARAATEIPRAEETEGLAGSGVGTRENVDRSGQPTVAVALDEAFRFIYPATMERLRSSAHVVTFSPVAGDDLPPCDALYLPGGYPEIHAAALTDSPALSTIRSRAADELPVLGECGGLMTLTESLTTTDGESFRMAGVLPGHVEMRDRYCALDHVELRATDDGISAKRSDRHRGHEFHYSELAFGDDGDGGCIDVDTDGRFAFVVERGHGIDGTHDGLCEHRTLGTYTHRHAESGAFDRLIDAAQDYAHGP